MADTENMDSDDTLTPPEDTIDGDATVDVADDEATEDKEPKRLQQEVSVEQRGACERHLTVTVSRDDIDRYFDREFTELMPTAQVPGFRPGRAPRKLIEAKFRKDVAEKVKSNLLMDSLTQIHDDEDLSAISEPDIDLESVEVPAEGPLTFEFDLEVRPQFDLPQWKGLNVEKPVRDFSDDDVDLALQNVMARRGRLVPRDEPAEANDYITTNLTFKHDDQVLSSAEEEVIRIRSVLSFRDGKIEEFDKLMVGVSAGETREGAAKLSEESPNVALRGQTIQAVFEVLEVKRLELPEMTDALLEDLGGFELEADLRDAIKDQLERQLEYEQHRRARAQITGALTVAADWDLPPDLLQRQSGRELERAVMELRRSGFSDNEIQAQENELRQHSQTSTGRALKEHFILERIAEEEEIDAVETDYDEEISLLARQSGESARRVRARIEKNESMDVLRNQIVERKVVELILEHAKFKEVPYEMPGAEAEAIDQAAGGHDSDIPEALSDKEEPAQGGKPEDAPIRE